MSNRDGKGKKTKRLAELANRVEALEARIAGTVGPAASVEVRVERLEPLPDAIVVRGRCSALPLAAWLHVGGRPVRGEVVPTVEAATDRDDGFPFACYFLLGWTPTVEDYRALTATFTTATGSATVGLADAVSRQRERDDLAYGVFRTFLDTLDDDTRLLEIGSRARLGTTMRHLFRGTYLGIDIVDGPNVDLVADAHLLADALAGRSFTHAVSASVFEHLACPLQAISELNAVLAPNGLVYISCHQTWGYHEAPWDYFRFSDSAWFALFNDVTGFEVIEAVMGDELMLVPIREHGNPSLNRMSDYAGAYATSVVLARKTGPSRVGRIFSKDDLDRIYVGRYPY